MMSISGIKRSIIKEPDPSFEDSSSDGSGFCHAEEMGKRMLAVLRKTARNDAASGSLPELAR